MVLPINSTKSLAYKNQFAIKKSIRPFGRIDGLI